jgi:hypothetical protein
VPTVVELMNSMRDTLARVDIVNAFLVGTLSIVAYMYMHLQIGAKFVSDTDIAGYYSGNAYHTSAIALNYIDNALARQLTNSDDLMIHTINHPLPYMKVHEMAAY